MDLYTSAMCPLCHCWHVCMFVEAGGPTLEEKPYKIYWYGSHGGASLSLP